MNLLGFFLYTAKPVLRVHLWDKVEVIL